MTSKTLQVTVSNSGKVKIRRFKLFTGTLLFLPSVSDIIKMYDPMECPYKLWFEVDGKNIYYMSNNLQISRFGLNFELGQPNDVYYTSKNVTGSGYMVGEFAAKSRIEMPRKFSVSYRR